MNLFFQCIILVYFCLHLEVSSVDGANIAIIYIVSSYSHRVSLDPLASALISKGHNVTSIAPIRYSKSHPKLNDIVPKTFEHFNGLIINETFNVGLRINQTVPVLFPVFDKVLTSLCNVLFESQEFIEWMDTNPKIDLIISDYHPDCGVGLSYILDSKFMIYNTLGFFAKYFESLGLPEESLVTSIDMPYKSNGNFWDRVKNTLVPLGWSYYEDSNVKFVEMIREYLKSKGKEDNLPVAGGVKAMLRNKVDLVLSTGNSISDQPRSLPPMFISVPGLHIQESNKPLSKELESFINSKLNGIPSEGFIYISLGTVAIASNLPEFVLNAFMQTVQAFPTIRFLWKWDGLIPYNLPQNLYMKSWFEQQDLLSHPKIKGFIYQGGRPSTQEGLSKGVPMISFPILGDQDYNSMRLEEIGSGINLEISTLTKDTLEKAVSRILIDKDFQAKVKYNSALFNDRPMKPIDTAVWWVEYVLRHNDLSHLKPLARHQSWFQRRLLDVWLFLFLSFLILIILCIGFLSYVIKVIRAYYRYSKVQPRDKLKKN